MKSTFIDKAGVTNERSLAVIFITAVGYSEGNEPYCVRIQAMADLADQPLEYFVVSFLSDSIEDLTIVRKIEEA